MTNYKQIDMRFWQNNFVLGLTPEERDFYMYLVTNTMTTKCGVYKFNMKVAELETGYTAEVIEKHLENFEKYGKIVISKSTKEIMIVNWFKHNFKNNKKMILDINKELKDIKNKEFIKELYDLCVEREYPVKEIFSGIILPGVERKEVKSIVVDMPKAEVVKEIELEDKALKEHDDLVSADELVSIEKVNEPGDNGEPAAGKELIDTAEVDNTGTLLGQFMGLQTTYDELYEEQTADDVEMEEGLPEEDEEDILEGTTIAFWEFDAT